ncbi:MAG: Na/Pi cotransporter family protein [Lachnospiraceae bacterium]|nr:Na/Pi cotransporter family protein [Lachnospiraceae bacterium]
MDFFDILSMIGGLALFLYGMNAMGDGLAKASGGRLERILEKLTSNPIRAVLLGAGVTAVIQSSSATTVMVVGFVNSGIMKLHQAVGIIMGANVGTTVTSWILSLSGLESDNFWLQLLKPSSFAPVLGIIGVALMMFQKGEQKKNVGQVLIGFAILMTGMDAMSSAVKPLADVPEFTGILTAFSNPILGMLAGALLTAVIQSSSASVGILQALCATGAVSYGTAIPIIMGQNIGTCATALISGAGASKNARRAALVHLYFNVIGTAVFMIIFYAVNALVHFSFLADPANAAGIAVVHTAFNVTATLVLLPFSRGLERLAILSIPDDEQPEELREFQLLDDRFLSKPGFAVEECRQVTARMAELTQRAIDGAFDLVEGEYSEEMANEIQALEAKIDRYEDELGTYLVKISRHSLSREDNYTVSILLHSIGNLERISDHAVNLMESARELHEKDIHFSADGAEELHVFTRALRDIVDRAIRTFIEGDLTLAATVEPLEETIDEINDTIMLHHIERLKSGECTIETGFVLQDIANNYERVADHCSNLAVCQLEVRQGDFDTHAYLHEVKATDGEFRRQYDAFSEEYRLG